MRDLVFLGFMSGLIAIALFRPFAGLMLWSWISFMSVHRLSWGFASGLSWGVITFGVTILGCIMAREPKRVEFNAAMVLIVAFMLWITFTTMFALQPAGVVWYYWDRTFKISLTLLLTAVLLTDRVRIVALVWLIVIGIGYFGVRGGIFTLTTGGGNRVLGPPDTMIADRNHLAVALLVVLPLMNWLRMHSAHRIVRIGFLVAMPVVVFSVLGSQSRGALVGLAAVALFLWLRTRGKIVSGVVIAVGLAGAITFMPQSWVDRMESMRTYEEDKSAMGRIEVWKTAWAIAVARPLTGGGFRATYSPEIVDRVAPGMPARATHSIYFEVLADQGFIGFGIWAAILGTGIWYTLRLTALSRDRPSLRWAGDLGRMMQVAFVAYLTGGAFLSLSYWDVLLTLVVILGATLAVVRRAIEAEAPARAGAAGPEPWRLRPATS